jgi:hypothetical protein
MSFALIPVLLGAQSGLVAFPAAGALTRAFAGLEAVRLGLDAFHMSDAHAVRSPPL